MKENQAIMDAQITQIFTTAITCMNGRLFDQIIIGLIVCDSEGTDTRHMELFYVAPIVGSVYFNELINGDEMDNSLEEQRFLELQDLLYKLQQYCASQGDAWRAMTMKIDNKGKFGIDFTYEPIEIAEWRKTNGL